MATGGGQTSTQVANNLIGDLLESERQLRFLVESESREMRAALRVAAYSFAGKVFEAEMQKSQTTIEKWTGEDWVAFFQQVAPVSRGWHDPAVLAERLRTVTDEKNMAMAEVARLQEEVKMRAELAVAGVLQTANTSLPASVQEEETDDDQPDDALFCDGFRWPKVPPKPPAKYSRLFSNWARQGMGLALVASGYSLRMEAAWLLGLRFNRKGTSGSIKGVFDEYLLKKGLLEREVIAAGRVGAAYVWLSDEGRKVCAAARIPVQETDVERLMRLHGGDAQRSHAAAASVFACHARRRGYRTEVVPEVEGPAEPDVLLIKDEEMIYVEVEAGREKEAKWKNMAALQGFVAVCTINEDGQRALVKEIKALGIPGRATDIERLAKDKSFTIDLWEEEWD